MKSFFLVLSLLYLFVHNQECVAQEKNKDSSQQIGRYSLQIVKDGEDLILYRLDSITGNVWIYDPTKYTSLTTSDWDSLSPELKKVADDQIAQGKNVFAATYWELLPNKLDGIQFK
jgi:hypothetical protein